MSTEIDNLYRTLNQYIEEEDHESIVDVSSRIVALASTDFDAFQIKIAGLLQLSEYTAALKLIETSRHASKLVHYKAYALYRSGKYQEAQKILTNNPAIADKISTKHLQAQIYIKLGHFEQSKKIYDELCTGESLSDPEFLVNYTSVCCLTERVSEIFSFLEENNLTAALHAMLSATSPTSFQAALSTPNASLITYELLTNIATAYLQVAASNDKKKPEDKYLAIRAALSYISLARRIVTNAISEPVILNDIHSTLGEHSQYETVAALEQENVTISDFVIILIQQALALQLFVSIIPTLSPMSIPVLSIPSIQAIDISNISSVSVLFTTLASQYYNQALELLANVTSKSVIDETSAVITINQLALSSVGTASGNPGEQRGERPSEIHDSIRQLQAYLSTGATVLPLPSQSNTAMINLALLYAHNRQPNEARQIIAKLPKSAQPSSDFIPILEAFLCFKDREFEKAESVIQAYAKSAPNASKRARLAFAHMATMRGNHSAAARYLHEWVSSIDDEDIGRKPAILATLIALHERAGESQLAATEIDSAIQYLTRELGKKSNNLTPQTYSMYQETLCRLQERLAQVKASSGDVHGAIELLHNLSTSARQRGDQEAAERFSTRAILLCVGSADPAADAVLRDAIAHTSSTAIATMGGDVDTQTLLRKGIPVNPTIMTRGITSTTSTTSAGMDDDREEEEDIDMSSQAPVESQYLANGKRRFSDDKLEKIRQVKRIKRAEKRKLPKNVTLEMVQKERQRVKDLIENPAAAAAAAAVVVVAPTTGKKKKGGAQGSTTTASQVGPDPYRWMPKWERPTTKAKKGANLKGPQGSGISERSVEYSKYEASTAKVAVDKNTRGGKRGKK